MNRLAILGGGSWGTALAIALAPNFEEVGLWVHDPELARGIAASRENSRYLPGLTLPNSVMVTADASRALQGCSAVLAVTPSAYLRRVLTDFRHLIPESAAIVSGTKGLEPGSLLRMSQVISEACAIRSERVLALSGPTFAVEVARGLPAAMVIAGHNEPLRWLQTAFARPTLRIYSSEDIVGVEIGGALKNVVAIGAGIASGLGLGHNAVAALITRGLAEITRLAVRLGADPRTLSGLAGLGDLVLTCTGELSRNRQLGTELSRFHSASGVLSASSATTEGVRTAAVAVQLGRSLGVEMPIAEQMSEMLHSRRSPLEAIRMLMNRSLKEEL